MGQPLRPQLDHLHEGFRQLFCGEPVLRGMWESGGHIAIADAFNGQIHYRRSQIKLKRGRLHGTETAEELQQQIQHLLRWLGSATTIQLSQLAHWAAARASELIVVLPSKPCLAHCCQVTIAQRPCLSASELISHCLHGAVCQAIIVLFLACSNYTTLQHEPNPDRCCAFDQSCWLKRVIYWLS